MDINKALAIINVMNSHKPEPVHHNSTQEVDLDFIIHAKPPIKIVRQYFEESIENLEDSE